MMLAPWVLLPGRARAHVGSVRAPAALAARLAAQSALAVALMGAVNAVATVAACRRSPVLWWIAHRPNRRWWRVHRVVDSVPAAGHAVVDRAAAAARQGEPAVPRLHRVVRASPRSGRPSPRCSAAPTAGRRSSPPSASRARSWSPSPPRSSATGLIAAGGLAGLCMRSDAGPRPPHADPVRRSGRTRRRATSANSAPRSPSRSATVPRLRRGPLRNVHKLEPLVRLPLVLGLAHLLAQVPLPGSVPVARWRSAFAHPEREPMVAVTEPGAGRPHPGDVAGVDRQARTARRLCRGARLLAAGRRRGWRTTPRARAPTVPTRSARSWCRAHRSAARSGA